MAFGAAAELPDLLHLLLQQTGQRLVQVVAVALAESTLAIPLGLVVLAAKVSASKRMQAILNSPLEAVEMAGLPVAETAPMALVLVMAAVAAVRPILKRQALAAMAPFLAAVAAVAAQA